MGEKKGKKKAKAEAASNESLEEGKLHQEEHTSSEEGDKQAPKSLQAGGTKKSEGGGPRQRTRDLIQSQRFDNVVLALIFVSSVSLAFEDPTEDPTAPSFRTQTLQVLDTWFLMAFTVEMLLKIFALGLLLGKNAYLRSHWVSD